MNKNSTPQVSAPEQVGISWGRSTEIRKDIIGVRTLDDGRREFLMHNEALCRPYYIAVSSPAPKIAAPEQVEGNEASPVRELLNSMKVLDRSQRYMECRADVLTKLMYELHAYREKATPKIEVEETPTDPAKEIFFEVRAVITHPDYAEQVRLDLAEVQYVTAVIQASKPTEKQEYEWSEGTQRDDLGKGAFGYSVPGKQVELPDEVVKLLESIRDDDSGRDHFRYCRDKVYYPGLKALQDDRCSRCEKLDKILAENLRLKGEVKGELASE